MSGEEISCTEKPDAPTQLIHELGVAVDEAHHVIDDLYHGSELSLLFLSLVVVHPDLQWHLQIETRPRKVSDDQHAEDEVEVLHSSSTVTPGIKVPDGHDRAPPNKHHGVARLVVRDAEVDGCPAVTSIETGADTANTIRGQHLSKHTVEVRPFPDRLNREGQHKLYGLLAFPIRHRVHHLYPSERYVERI
ncbi:MAG: hypothetical protein UV82_C0006G0051 [Candidatus Magasanikbacteria bacterium GW2011_GWD2_43_18]|uniref:Uncharacterized protein n=1 Tax=Candidatus Magasanikbacteria bacterium GW2011_GWE2_42_7 TaxID=1619052 RepID=A0A0G1BDU1_9BACT|nr:MAG: hypothetical protein UV18_C0005G0036 [Candidatus Magasanikbacteria bacterium GW2011_GWC2_42_27]KKS71472.1 MAG: hypothetical protein UV42_C0027G0008 [Candidatus Magasanikbacteria bacterium GW2011_GWE2_42_7]KKT04695.1 MAG: hypothetical protein UV82_C0006G0051 [Candidatus Magasanikbacteria bacterium GW2011_GWD2_43_18]KKT24999.1 MAG: hypothetical protein UW10_C0016G0032 [Candidatus Magasanikbacteria bacterium GW2011_GWA2_43_9]